MSYIGRGTESISNVEVLDNLTFDGSASYTLQKSSTNFVPSSANNLLISISGVVQQGNFSVSGSTITFDTTVSASDTCDWILHYGTGLITTVADGAITEAKLGNNAVTASKIDSSVALGKIGQVVQGSELTSEISISSTTAYSDILSASITPTSTSSKILILYHLFRNMRATSGDTAGNLNRITRDGSEIYFVGKGYGQSYNSLIQGTGVTAIDFWWDSGYQYLDSPSTTSSVEYKIQGINEFGTYLRARGGLITLMEVLA